MIILSELLKPSEELIVGKLYSLNLATFNAVSLHRLLIYRSVHLKSNQFH